MSPAGSMGCTSGAGAHQSPFAVEPPGPGSFSTQSSSGEREGEGGGTSTVGAAHSNKATRRSSSDMAGTSSQQHASQTAVSGFASSRKHDSLRLRQLQPRMSGAPREVPHQHTAAGNRSSSDAGGAADGDGCAEGAEGATEPPVATELLMMTAVVAPTAAAEAAAAVTPCKESVVLLDAASSEHSHSSNHLSSRGDISSTAGSGAGQGLLTDSAHHAHGDSAFTGWQQGSTGNGFTKSAAGEPGRSALQDVLVPGSMWSLTPDAGAFVCQESATPEPHRKSSNDDGPLPADTALLLPAATQAGEAAARARAARAAAEAAAESDTLCDLPPAAAVSESRADTAPETGADADTVTAAAAAVVEEGLAPAGELSGWLYTTPEQDQRKEDEDEDEDEAVEGAIVPAAAACLASDTGSTAVGGEHFCPADRRSPCANDSGSSSDSGRCSTDSLAVPTATQSLPAQSEAATADVLDGALSNIISSAISGNSASGTTASILQQQQQQHAETPSALINAGGHDTAGGSSSSYCYKEPTVLLQAGNTAFTAGRFPAAAKLYQAALDALRDLGAASAAAAAAAPGGKEGAVEVQRKGTTAAAWAVGSTAAQEALQQEGQQEEKDEGVVLWLKCSLNLACCYLRQGHLRQCVAQCDGLIEGERERLQVQCTIDCCIG